MIIITEKALKALNLLDSICIYMLTDCEKKLAFRLAKQFLNLRPVRIEFRILSFLQNLFANSQNKQANLHRINPWQPDLSKI